LVSAASAAMAQSSAPDCHHINPLPVQPAPEQPASEQPGPEQPAPEQPAPEQPAPPQPVLDQIAVLFSPWSGRRWWT
jgi:hypothetical protein